MKAFTTQPKSKDRYSKWKRTPLLQKQNNCSYIVILWTLSCELWKQSLTSHSPKHSCKHVSKSFYPSPHAAECLTSNSRFCSFPKDTEACSLEKVMDKENTNFPMSRWPALRSQPHQPRFSENQVSYEVCHPGVTNHGSSASTTSRRWFKHTGSPDPLYRSPWLHTRQVFLWYDHEVRQHGEIPALVFRELGLLV